MRWLTLTVVNDDPGKFDPDIWLAYIQRCHVDAASWNFGGTIAIYATQIPVHRRTVCAPAPGFPCQPHRLLVVAVDFA